MTKEVKSDYQNIHIWLRYHHGNASKCSNVNCVYPNPKRFEWALLKGKEHEKNIENYIELCPSCHRKYDGAKGIKCKKIKCLTDGRVFDSYTKAAKFFGVTVGAISKALKNKHKLKGHKLKELKG